MAEPLSSTSTSTSPTQPPEIRDFSHTLALQTINENEFTTVHPPERMGNTANIAYGGFALALATKAASLSVPSTHHLYSIMGHYLGPALTDRPLHATVTRIRQTRTFATRQVQVSQLQDDGTSRACLIALADFQTKESASLLVYNAPPLQGPYTHYSELACSEVQSRIFVDEGKIQPAVYEAWLESFSVMRRLYEVRPTPEGIFSQNLMGAAKHLPTSQSHLPITERTTSEWLHSRSVLESPHDQLASLAFTMDGSISFAPLAFNGMFLDDAGACSSLDFAMRVFVTEVKLEEWLLKEIRTHVGGEGRTFSEGRLWDEEGRCVASMTQQSILRPGKGRGTVKL
ncbi:thioesterase-like superfamily-domain-containing protein [Dendryphion nanum]|uniref:Thioesterase-like superfamily-domain-containing protein n=1 Tax=Dendryphion nanum TaxID=256645 RepID=A0A9P9IVV9_9PLEO|nr:thioesterase-like superfamily-domain-containing protein [Dendryphion nanum]